MNLKPTFIILGAGGIGSGFGATLSNKYPVELIGNAKHVKQINFSGLRLTENIEKIYKIPAYTKINKIPDNTFILLTTKAHEGITALKSIKNILKKDTVIVIIQNGLGQEEDIKKLLPGTTIIRTVTECGAIFETPGKVRFMGTFPTYIEKNNSLITDYFDKVNIPYKVVTNIRKYEWNKLFVNCVINSLGTILNVYNYQLDFPSLTPVKKAIIAECVAVARADGYRFNANKILATVNAYIKKSKNSNSTLQDIHKGRKTEMDYLNGAVVKLGKKYHIPTPVNEALYNIIKTMEISSNK